MWTCNDHIKFSHEDIKKQPLLIYIYSLFFYSNDTESHITTIFRLYDFSLKFKSEFGKLACFSANFANGDNFCVFLFASPGNEIFSKLRSTLKGKNLLLEEQILLLKC